MQYKVDTLPSEILTTIFASLPKETLFICLCVCKSWFHSASQIYYRRFYINNSNKDGDITKLAQYINSIPVLSIGYNVKSIQIDGQQQIKGRIILRTKTTPSSKQELQILLQLCPNLQELAFSINSIYWKHIYEMDHHNGSMIRPRRVYTVGKQRCYEEEYFYKVAHQFRSSISELDIHCSCDESIHSNFGSLYSYLADFPLLRSLSIKSGSQRYIIYFQKLLETSPHLKKLSFQLDHPFFELPLTVEKDYQLWSEYPSMQELDIYISNFGVQQLQYIIQRFTRLKKFSLRINQNDDYQMKQWKDEKINDLKSVIQFFKHDFIKFLADLDSLHLYFNIHNQSYIENLLELFYLPCSISKISPNIFVNAVYEVHHGRTERTQIELSKQKKGQIQSINYTFVRDFSVTDPLLDEEHVEPTQPLPYISHLKSYGQLLQSLSITITVQEKHEEASDIDLVLRLCPNLQELAIVLERSPVTYFSHDASFIHIQHPPSLCWNYNSCTALSSKLSSLTIKGMTINSELLNTLALHHPNLKNLSLINCSSEFSTDIIEPNAPKDSRISTFVYDLSNLHLDSLVFDIFTHRCSKKLVSSMICIVVEKEDRTCNHYLAKQQKHQVAGELFKSITGSHYEDLVSDTELAMTVLWFKVQSLNELELQAGRNQSYIKKILY
ncbi:hypothetical protein INT46_005080 [Mucor plumbeus]|uniref:F-box domain-containing protein n=1 Tax=Mucor plumbeus TaxID=97098 RepID=A0A8H7V3Z5_9FUNG|nr:hypothetical protein INT46_005080 [Mucor plumbeus]